MTKSVSINNKPTVAIDSTTPVDVSVSGNVNVASASALDVNINNSALSTNATIQNSNIDVTVQNNSLNSYQYVNDGNTWRFKLSDSNGKAINLDHTYYTSAEITALGSSTDINLWLSAYNDSMLQNKYVSTYTDEHEETVFYQHPSLGNGNKCLRLIYQYSTQNNQTVVQSILAAVSDWSYSDEIIGTVSVTVSNVVSANPNSAIPVHTKIADISFTSDTVGNATISLSGTNASLYHIYDTTTSTGFSSGTFSSNGVYELHAASDFSGSSYSHTLNVNITGDLLGPTDSAVVNTSGTMAAVSSYANQYAIESSNVSNQTSDFYLVPTTGNTEKSLWPSLGGGTNKMPSVNDDLTVALWLKTSGYANNTGRSTIFTQSSHATSNVANAIHFYIFRSSNKIYLELFYCSSTDILKGATYNMNYSENTWYHIAWVKQTGIPSSSTIDLYVNGSSVSLTNINLGSTLTTTAFDNSNVGVTEIFSYPRWRSASYNRTLARPIIDEMYAIPSALTQTQVQEFITSSGAAEDPDNLSFIGNVDSYFRFGDGSNDNVTLDRSYDEKDSNRYFENNNNAEIVALFASDDPYVPASGSWSNLKYVKGPAYYGSTSNSSYGVYSEISNGGFLSTTSSTQDYSTNPMTLNFWAYIPSVTASYSSTMNLIGDLYNHDARIIELQARDSYMLITSTDSSGYASSRASITRNQWVMITVVFDSNTVGDCDMYQQTSSTFSNTKINTTNYGSTTSFNSSGNTISVSTIMSPFGYLGNRYPASSGASNWDGVTAPRIDEVTVWDKALSLTEIEELSNNHNPMDPTTHSAYTSNNSVLKRYVRWGDGNSDTENSVQCEIDNTFVLNKESTYISNNRITSY